jgi:benzil reductase ((S)-benzoin forming)
MNPAADSEPSFAIVTGTTSGIGAAVAVELLRRGWMVAGIARRSSAIDHPAYRHLSLDLADVERATAAIEAELSPVVSTSHRRVGLVNNAAEGGTLGPLETLQPARLLHTDALNAVAPMWLMGFVVRHVPAGASLRIVNVSTGAAVHPFPGLAAYSASKAALRMAGMVLAAELESPLRKTPAPADTAILSYEPGIVDTEMQTAARARPLDQFPWGRLFHDFADEGRLVPPQAPAADVVAFLESHAQPRFAERRLGGETAR